MRVFPVVHPSGAAVAAEQIHLIEFHACPIDVHVSVVTCLFRILQQTVKNTPCVIVIVCNT
jgi:hypothetical protein